MPTNDNIGTAEDRFATTDKKGEYSLELPPGFYDVIATATAFSPHCEKIRIKGKATKRHDVVLKVSPVTSKELD
ncbi:carboxypeptidase-like regulatory domain-containing protein [Occallatibacter savannae]|uniref:carboxypeptidase-like regulatory domain-containing protein n=1 Tax=Occallatibacter savannae TaxID=1002691 RepID=UPI000D69FFA4|nr:carboxypeptidase-like regulatory domain-containing protein [Occallatibacter savannae]